jgi:hypothetical protein
MFGRTGALLAAATVATSLAGGSAQAITVVCPSSIPGTGTVRVMTIDVASSTPASSCHSSSDENSIPLTLAGYDLLDKFGSDEGGEQANGALTIVQASEGQGTFSINQTLVEDFFNFVLALKDGNNASPKIEYFSLGPGIFSGGWTLEEWVNGVFDKYKGFSSAILFGQDCPVGGCPDPVDPPSDVPLPGAVWLFGSALAGLGLLSMRRRRSKSLS